MKSLLILPVCLLLFVSCQNGVNSASPASVDGGSTGKAGSMARFGIVGNRLYALSSDKVHIFDVSQSQTPNKISTLLLGSGVETIFPYADKLFFGTTTGMLIYDNSNTSAPTYISRYEHITSCDPVVVSGKYAYVTLRSGTRCRNGTNRLDIVDLSDITQPKLFNSFAMTNPHGLGIDDSTLFLCDGTAGLKVYDVRSPGTLVVLAEYPNIHSYDVIPNRSSLVMTGDSGVYQYDYSDRKNIHQISSIGVK